MTAAVKTVVSGSRNLHINVTGTFNVADETDTLIVDKSTLTNSEGIEPDKLRIDRIQYSIQGYGYVLLEWDTAADEVVDYYSGDGCFDYMRSGGLSPAATDGTGDIVLTTGGGAAGGSYSLHIEITLK